jgi:hypothetical protein
MELNLDRVRSNVQKSSTEDLLDRITVYRDGMEAEAIAIIEEELLSRGLGEEAIENHRQRRQEILLHRDGLPASCSFCERPAITEGWGWHRMWGKIPVFPRKFRYCEVHQPKKEISPSDTSERLPE